MVLRWQKIVMIEEGYVIRIWNIFVLKAKCISKKWGTQLLARKGTQKIDKKYQETRILSLTKTTLKSIEIFLQKTRSKICRWIQESQLWGKKVWIRENFKKGKEFFMDQWSCIHVFINSYLLALVKATYFEVLPS